jgi:hypothetical protein
MVHLAALLLPCYLTCFFLLLICFLDGTKQPFWLASPCLATCFFGLWSWAPTCNHHGHGPLLGVWDNILVCLLKLLVDCLRWVRCSAADYCGHVSIILCYCWGCDTSCHACSDSAACRWSNWVSLTSLASYGCWWLSFGWSLFLVLPTLLLIYGFLIITCWLN